MTGITLQMHIGHKLHLYGNLALALAFFAAASINIEREVFRLIITDLAQFLCREQGPNVIVGLDIGHGVATRRPPNGVLVHEFHVFDMPVLTLQFVELARFQVLSGKNNWTPPTYANGRMHCRSSSGRWVCLAMGKGNE